VEQGTARRVGVGIFCAEDFDMANKPTAPKPTPKQPGVSHPGMMGDGTEEQNLGERGNPGARIKKDELDVAFGKPKPKKKP
jgi:hypothetical protein